LSCSGLRTAGRAGLTPAWPLVPGNAGFPTAMDDRGAGVAVRHARPPAGRQAPAALPAPPGRRPPTGPAPSRCPGRPRPAVPDRHRPEALLKSGGAPEGCPDRRRDGKEPQHAAPLSLGPSCTQGRNVRRCCTGFGELSDKSERVARMGASLVRLEPWSRNPPVPNARYRARGPCRSAAASRRIHVDVMDSHFANRTFGPGPVAAFAPLVHGAGRRGMVECHLIVEDPDRYPNM
jgi:hypothetical protein